MNPEPGDEYTDTDEELAMANARISDLEAHTDALESQSGAWQAEAMDLRGQISTTEAALAEAEQKLSARYVAAMEAAQRIGDLEYENRALLTRISLAIGRIERGEPGAALTGLQAALVNAEMGDEQ